MTISQRITPQRCAECGRLRHRVATIRHNFLTSKTRRICGRTRARVNCVPDHADGRSPTFPYLISGYPAPRCTSSALGCHRERLLATGRDVDATARLERCDYGPWVVAPGLHRVHRSAAICKPLIAKYASL